MRNPRDQWLVTYNERIVGVESTARAAVEKALYIVNWQTNCHVVAPNGVRLSVQTAMLLNQ